MKSFMREIKGLHNKSIFYTDTDNLYEEKKYWDVLDKASLVGSDLCQGKDDYESGVIFYRLYLATKMKHCLTMDWFGSIEEYKTFKSCNDSKRLLDHSQFFKKIQGKKYQPCYQTLGKHRLITEISYQQNWLSVINVLMKQYVINKIFKSTKVNQSKLI